MFKFSVLFIILGSKIEKRKITFKSFTTKTNSIPFPRHLHIYIYLSCIYIIKKRLHWNCKYKSLVEIIKKNCNCIAFKTRDLNGYVREALVWVLIAPFQSRELVESHEKLHLLNFKLFRCTPECKWEIEMNSYDLLYFYD